MYKNQNQKIATLTLLALVLLFLCFSNLSPTYAQEQKNWVFDDASNYTLGSNVEVAGGKAHLKRDYVPGTNWIDTDGGGYDWRYRRRVEITNTDNEYDLSDSVVRILVAPNMSSDGNDFRLTSALAPSNYASGTEWTNAQATNVISHWTEYYSQSTGWQAIIWAKVPSIFASNAAEDSGTDNKVLVNDDAGFLVGMTVKIKDDNNSETNTITAINTGTNELTFENNFSNDYGLADNARVCRLDYIYLYFGNSNASSTSNGANIFDLFDDFPGSEIDTNKWGGDTTGFSIVSGELKGTNTTGRLQSDTSFTSPAIQGVKVRTTAKATNGQTLAGFFASAGDGFGFLEFGSSDYLYVNGFVVIGSVFATDGTSYSILIDAETGTTVDYEARRLDTNAQVTAGNDIINIVSSEKVTLGKRYDDAGAGQAYVTYWDYIFADDNPGPATYTTLTYQTLYYPALWQYRRPVTINNTSGGDLTNYQVRINLNTSALISTSKMQTYCADIRVTDSNGTTELNHWVSGCNGAATEIWVKVPLIDASSEKTIYLYYGNKGAQPASNADDVFIFADDFTETKIDTDKWTQYSDETQSDKIFNTKGSTPGLISKTDISRSFVAEVKVTSTNTTTEAPFFGIHDGDDSQAYPHFIYGWMWNLGNWVIYEDGTSRGILGSYAIDIDYRLKWEVFSTGCKYYSSTDNGQNWTLVRDGSAYSSEDGIRVGFGSDSFFGEFDDWIVRQYTSTEPSTSVSSEENVNWPSGDVAKLTVVNNTGREYAQLVSFIEILGSENEGSVKYQISDNSTDWYWYDSGQTKWVSASGLPQTNTSSEVSLNIGDFMEDIGKSGETGTFFFKAFLVSDGSQRVELDSITLTYTYDTYPPENPSSITMLAGSTELTSDKWYNYQEGLRFTWPAACDPGIDCGTGGAKDLVNPAAPSEGTSGVDGYYVYFGEDSSADPKTEGSYQVESAAGNSFDCSDLSDSDSGKTFYFRIKTKDKAGYVSDAQTLFVYKFDLYLQDTTPPINPSDIQLTINNQQLTTNTWYNYQEDLIFSWPKACDPEIDCDTGGAKDLLPSPNPNNEGTLGLDGYYVYFGEDLEADPETKGKYQTEDSEGNSYTKEILSPSLSGKTLYFRIKTKDKAGNKSDSETLFIYKFDITKPNPPGSLSHVPLGYTPKNEFTFIWGTSSDKESGFQGYCYKTGDPNFTSDSTCDNDGKFTENTSISTQEDPQVKAYQEGQNIFYVRSLDKVGNFSDWAQDIYYFAGTAPLEPQNLKVSPSTSESKPASKNEFSFAWTAPLSYSSPIKGYYYSINTLPSEYTATFTTQTLLASASFATQQGKNTFYLVAQDEAENIDWTKCASVDFFCETKAPGAPRDLTISDASIRAKEQYAVTLMWSEPEEEGSGIDQYILERAEKKAEEEKGSKPLTLTKAGLTFEEIAQVPSTSTGYLDTNLDTNKVYYYKVKAQDNAQAVSRASEQVGMRPEGRYTSPPEISEIKLEPQSFGAKVSWKTDRPTTSHVQFGKKSTEEKEQGVEELVEEHEITIVGLNPETTYIYRVKSKDRDENINYSDTSTFKTLEAPKVSEVTVSDITLTSATISWKTNLICTSKIEYGITTDYGSLVYDTSESKVTSHTLKLESLSSGATYHYRIAGIDLYENTVLSDDYTFATPPYPRVISQSTENKQEGQTEVRWSTNVATTSEVEYWSEEGNVAPKTQGATPKVTEHSILLFALEDDTTYSFRLRGRDQFGNEAVSDTSTFHTLKDTTPPVISEVYSESNVLGYGEKQKVQIIVAWKTNEPASSKVSYGEGVTGDFSGETEEFGDLVLEHLVVISDLKPSKIYHFKVESFDKARNSSASETFTVLTSRKRESFLQLIVGVLEDTFAWVRNIKITR